MARAVPTLETFTGGAMDALRIAAFAGFDVKQLVRTLVLESNPQRKINAGRVWNMMQKISDTDKHE